LSLRKPKEYKIPSSDELMEENTPLQLCRGFFMPRFFYYKFLPIFTVHIYINEQNITMVKTTTINGEVVIITVELSSPKRIKKGEYPESEDQEVFNEFIATDKLGKELGVKYYDTKMPIEEAHDSFIEKLSEKVAVKNSPEDKLVALGFTK